MLTNTMENEKARPLGVTLIAAANVFAAVYITVSPQAQAPPAGSYVLPLAPLQVLLCMVSGISLWKCLEWGRLITIARGLVLMGSQLYSLSSPYLTASMAQIATLQTTVSLLSTLYLTLPGVRECFNKRLTAICHICGSTSFSWISGQRHQGHSNLKDSAEDRDWWEKISASMGDEMQSRRCNNCSNIQFFATEKAKTEPDKERREQELNGDEPDNDTEDDEAEFVPPEEMGLVPKLDLLWTYSTVVKRGNDDSLPRL